MGLVDFILAVGKFLIGMGVGFVLVVAGMYATGVSGGDLVGTGFGFVAIIIGVGLVLWGENNRRGTLGHRRRR